jgi:DNA polymerase-3 subunit delta'
MAQKRAVRLLASALYTGALPHAFLFAGRDGTGKRNAAAALAMAANCDDPYPHPDGHGKTDGHTAIGPDELHSCGRCRSCRKILAGSHPDIHIVEPSGKMIKVDQIRALCRKLALKPYEASLRVAVIAGAQTLNAEAGNMLLKTLEEPPDRTVFVLTALQTSDLLPTILSRCRHIRFAPIPLKLLSRYLEDHHNINPITAAAIASMADGSITEASRMAESGWVETRNRIIERIETMTTPGERLAFSESLSGHKEQLPEVFGVMQSWFRDLIISRMAPEKTIHRDLSEKMERYGPPHRIESLLSKINAIDIARQDIQSNANVRLTLDALMLSLAMKE